MKWFLRKNKDQECWEVQLLKLEQIREEILKGIERLEAAKIVYFERGRQETAQAKRLVLAEKIRLLDVAVKSHNERIIIVNKQIEFVSNSILGLQTRADVVIRDFAPAARRVEKIYEEQKIWLERFDMERLEVESAILTSEAPTFEHKTQEILDLFNKTNEIMEAPRTLERSCAESVKD